MRVTAHLYRPVFCEFAGLMDRDERLAPDKEVPHAIGSIASVTQQSSATTEEVSASAEEMSAQAAEVSAQAEDLAALAGDLRQLVARFTVDAASGNATLRRPAPGRQAARHAA